MQLMCVLCCKQRMSNFMLLFRVTSYNDAFPQHFNTKCDNKIMILIQRKNVQNTTLIICMVTHDGLCNFDVHLRVYMPLSRKRHCNRE